MQDELRIKAKELLQSGQVKMIIGCGAGSVPFKSTPLFATTPEEADQLLWNPTCVNNLAVYLPDAIKQGKVGVVLKPVDAKSVVELIKENQIKREDVVAIVVSSPGMLDADALVGIDLKDIKAVDWKNGGVAVTTSQGETIIPADKAYGDRTGAATSGEPVLADVKIGEFSGDGIGFPTEKMTVEEYDKLSPAERREFWTKQFSRCIRCYACRQVCPGCYCKECFIDKEPQLWALKATDPVSNWFFHVTRMMHIAGRCIQCGECERACPMGIPLLLMSRKVAEDVKEMFGEIPGQDTEDAQILGSYKDSDPDPCPE